MAESDAEDRTFAASEKRLREAREEGRVPLSREVVAFSGLALSALLLTVSGPHLAHALTRRLEAMLAAPTSPGEAMREAGAIFVLGALGVAATCAVAGAAAVLLQTGFLFRGKALMPDLARLNPASGLKRIFGGANAVEAGKSLGKVAVLGWAFWRVGRVLWSGLDQAISWTPAALADRLGREMVGILMVVVAVQAGFAILDLAWTRWRFAQKLRMSREDMKNESREQDGDPRVKGRLRQIRQARARRRTAAAVAKATVVITNPTHYAVALAYERGTQAAPRVVAKGMDEAAARIRAIAERSGVPIMPNPPLARALYLVPLDREVPEEHFRMVAEIIAYVWRLGRRADQTR